MLLSPRPAAAGLIVLVTGAFACLGAQEGGIIPEVFATRWFQHDVRRPKPGVVEPAEATIPAKPPKDAIVLFDGTSLDAWKSREGGPAKWKIVDGTMETVPGAGMIETKQSFGDIQLHIEWATPSPAVGKGQDRGNSGVFLMGEYEVQVLDSYKAETYADGQAGAIYGQYPPLFNASRPPGQWQTYDIAFRRARFDEAGKLLEPARITVIHNGILIQNNEEAFGPTAWLKTAPYVNDGGKGPLALQDHDHPVHFRNIWLRELPERAAPTPEMLARSKAITLPADLLDRYAGQYQTDPDKPAVATFARDGDHLTVTYPSKPRKLLLNAINQTQFDLPDTDGRYTFKVDVSGKVTGVHFRIGDGERDMKRVGP